MGKLVPLYSRHLIVVLFSLVLLSACGSKQEAATAVSVSQPESPIHAPSEKEALKIYNSAWVKCENASDCNPSVGMMIIRFTGVDLGRCTGFQIGPDVIATNSHCIPEDLKKPGTSCKGRIGFLQPENSIYPFERVECDQIIDASDLSNGHPIWNRDYAFFKTLRPILRPGLNFESAGIAVTEEIEVVKANPAGNQSPGAYLGREKCKIVENDLYAPFAEGRNRPVLGISGCQVIHGNSGSPMILAGTRSVVGVVQSTIDQPSLVYEKLEKAGFGPSRDLRPHGYGTSFACVQNPLQAPRSLAAECSAPMNEKSFHQALGRLGASLLIRQIPGFTSEASHSSFRWTMTAKNSSGNRWKMNLIPDCVLKEKRDEIASIESLKTYQVEAGMSVDEDLEFQLGLISKTLVQIENLEQIKVCED